MPSSDRRKTPVLRNAKQGFSTVCHRVPNGTRCFFYTGIGFVLTIEGDMRPDINVKPARKYTALSISFNLLINRWRGRFSPGEPIYLPATDRPSTRVEGAPKAVEPMARGRWQLSASAATFFSSS